MPLHLRMVPPPRFGEGLKVIRLHLEDIPVGDIIRHLVQQPVERIVDNHDPGMLRANKTDIDHILVEAISWS